MIIIQRRRCDSIPLHTHFDLYTPLQRWLNLEFDEDTHDSFTNEDRNIIRGSTIIAIIKRMRRDYDTVVTATIPLIWYRLRKQNLFGMPKERSALQ